MLTTRLPVAAVTATILVCGALGALTSAQGRSVASGIYSEAQAARGSVLFAEHCAPCHGTDLAGTDFGPGLSSPELPARWKRRSVGELFSLMRSTMPLNSPGGLSARQNADILAFILQRAKFPAGAGELPADDSALGQVRFEMPAR